MENLRTIRLYGKLGAQFGRVHRLAVENTAEAIRALCVLVPGFERELMTSRERGVRYACFLGKQNIGKDELALSGGAQDIRIAPVIAGAKSGLLGTLLLGAALVVAGWAVAGFTAFTALGGVGFTVGSAISSYGVAVMVGGVVQALSPQQSGSAAAASTENGASYNFSGAVNTTIQGGAVPVLYGRMIVGSAVISAGIVAQEQAYVGAPATRNPIPKAKEFYEDQQ
ncbi:MULTISPECIES: tail assembly protein [unclassified Massilia]|uniref:tail assembly protein n=1 Tax=unclassified Massilia TaxID=2609279 RepID=UPI0017821AA6|nr:MULTISPECIES: tail assembly protein [unclassified Massilia]MBD8531582.1 tail assembly protein [Massilia sp. CFBP 13647]MBD8673622.1 tail assembly protein [Massilia sp. CFBP 13721]